jgi:glucose/arabinose dehydrogenase
MADNSRRLTSIPEEGQQPEATSNVANTDTTSKSKRRWDTVKRVVKRLQKYKLNHHSFGNIISD